MRRALLLFVTEYESKDWVDLDFLEGEFGGVLEILSAHGYEMDSESCSGAITAAEINLRIERFFGAARPGDNLLVYLSGHGFHYEDSHWFAASDSNLDAGKQTMRVTNVPLDKDWPASVAASRAEHVLFVVDACRDRLTTSRGYQPPVMPPEGSERLSYLMACEPERPATYLNSSVDPDERYSLFTQAIRNVLADVDGYLPVDRFRDLLEVEMDDLRTRHHAHIQRQVPRLSGEEGATRFPILDAPCSDVPEVAEAVVQHDVWNRVTGGFTKNQIAQEVAAVASKVERKMAEERILLAEDPWIDWESHRRASRHCAEILQMLPEGFSFNPIEAALLLLGHQLYQGFRVQLARQVDQALKRSFASPELKHSAWSQYPRLQRLTDTRIDPSRGQRDRRVVEAWVLHQDLANPGDSHKHGDELLNYRDSVLSGTDDLTEALNIDLLSWLFRAMQRGGSTLAEPPSLPPVQGVPVRHQFVGYLLTISQIMTLDMCELPSVLVEHIGGRNRIKFREVRENIRGARWQLVGRTLRLEAACDHQAIMVALQERAESLDGLLYTAGSVPGLEPLPSRASGDGVGPVEDPVTKRGKFLPVATRFGLDGTRVRDLLAGEQLYADRSLAIRELYQNALDACNVRQARELWNPGSVPGDAWQGQIEIRQVRRGTRHVVECIDNGSGMGRGELLHAFAQGGVRLSHLSEFQEEKLQWRKKGIAFHENSRFGIGVLSYFMIADEIEVITRKFQRDRISGRLLRVVISGPDHLFHVEESTDESDFLGDECGTLVRCYLRSDLTDFSCVKALRAVLGVAKFSTVAKHEDDCEIWEQGTYRHRVNAYGVSPIDGSGTIVSDPAGDVFWCEHGGSLLIDGIYAQGTWPTPRQIGETRPGKDVLRVPGAVVNLTGRVVVSEGKTKSAPRLTVDRSHVIDDISGPVSKRLRAATASLATASFLNHEWLEKAAASEPRLADVVVHGLIEQNALLPYGDGNVRMGRTGFLSFDRSLRVFWSHPSPHSKLGSSRVQGRLPAHISLWRYVAHFPEDVKRALGDLCPVDWDTAEVRPALPSDAVAIGVISNLEGSPFWAIERPLVALPKNSAKLHEDLADTVNRLLRLNLQIPGSESLLDLPASTLSSLLHTLLHVSVRLEFSVYPGDKRVHPGRFLRACDDARIPALEMMDYLKCFGYDLQYCAALFVADMADRVKILLSERLDGNSPWHTDDKLSSARVLQASERLQEGVDSVLESYAELGILPRRYSEYGESGEEDTALLSALGRSVSNSGRALIPDVLRACLATGEEPAAVVERVSALGIRVEGVPPERMPDHAGLLEVPLASGKLLDPRVPISLPDLNAIHQRTGLDMQFIADQLRTMGFSVSLANIPALLEGDDERLLVKRLSVIYRSAQWVNPENTVPRAHVLLASALLRKSPQEIVERLRHLGMQVDSLPEDLPQLDVNYGEERRIAPWIPYDGVLQVPPGHILWVALEKGWTVPEAVENLKARGLILADIPEEMVHVSQEDSALLGHRPAGHFQNISFAARISTEEVVKAARRAGIAVEAAYSRLVELGANISAPREERAIAYPDESLFKEFPVGLDTVPAAFVMLKANEMGSTPEEIRERLVAAGLRVQEFDYCSIDRPDPEDLLLLRNKASSSGAFLPLAVPVSLEHLLVSAHRLQKTIGEVAGRLRELGLKVGDVAEMVDNAWSRVPKSS